MPTWKINPYTGAKSIPDHIQESAKRRVLAYAAKHAAGKYNRIDVRFRGAYCYVDAYTEPGELLGDPPSGETHAEWTERLRNTPTHLCGLRYFGNADLWSFAFYTYAQEKYEPSFTMAGSNRCTPEEAFATCANFL
jgi:hypothetical protein